MINLMPKFNFMKDTLILIYTDLCLEKVCENPPSATNASCHTVVNGMRESAETSLEFCLCHPSSLQSHVMS
jgi:hypothetical protein